MNWRKSSFSSAHFGWPVSFQNFFPILIPFSEMKQLHETIYEFQRTEKMWIEDGGTVDSRLASMHPYPRHHVFQSVDAPQKGPRAAP